MTDIPYKPYLDSSGGPSSFLFNSFHHFHQVIVGVGGQGVAAGVQAQGGPPGQLQVNVDECRFHLVELHVPVAVGRQGLLQPLAQGDLAEGGAIWRKVSRVLVAAAAAVVAGVEFDVAYKFL